uniref:Cyclodeaminase/cyclohydrolase domain-containing protein n=1 Tax=Desulfacinum infernum TaxID=35837 RepID=A0A831ZJ94_9BACT
MQTDDAFLDALRKPRPDPGGGSAAAHGALMALCLLEKVVVLEKNRTHAARDKRGWWDGTLEELRRLEDDLKGLRTEDVAAYRRLASALKAENPDQGRDDAAEAALRVPLAIMETAAEALRTAAAVGRRCAIHLRADVAVAVEFLGSAVQAAYWIARANALLVQNPERQTRLVHIVRQGRDAGARRWRAVRRELEKDGEARRR